MNGLELIMRQGDGHQGRQIRFMQELFPSGEACLDFFRRRRNEGCRRKSAAGSPNPVLDFSEFSRCCCMAAHARHKFLVQFPDNPHAKRQLFQTFDSVFERNNIIPHFTQVGRAAIHCYPGFRSQQFT